MATPPRNPYVAGRAISSARGFWGRTDVFHVVQEELSHPDRNAVVLFGQRRIGKTSILLNLRSRLPSPPFVTVYFDLMDRARQPLNEVLFEIARAIADEMNLPLPARAEFERDPTTFRQQFLAGVYESLGPDRRLILLFDEFDVLDLHQQDVLPEGSAARTFFPYLRETMTREPRLGFVVVVGRKSGELSTDFKSTFKAARYVRVSVLGDDNARELILTAQGDGSLRFDERAVERILALTAGHPYFTQLVCQLVFERAYNARTSGANAGVPVVTAEDVDATVPQALEAGENIFEWIWDGLPPAERVIFSAIASNTAEGAVVTEERLLATLQDSGVRILVRELELAPKTLIEWGMLKEVSGGYAFFIELMRRWVATRKPLAKVKDELDRINPLADTLFQGANGYYRRGDYDDAIAQLRQALSVNPNHLKARLLLGEVYREQGKLDDMVRELEAAYRIDPDTGRVAYEGALLLRAEASERADQQQAAVKDYERVLEISPNNRTAQQRSAAIATERLEREAEAFVQSGRWADAETAFQQLLAFDANNARWREGLERVTREQSTAGRYAEGLQAMQQGDWALAQRAFADVVYAQPDYSLPDQLSAATLLAEATQRARATQPARRPITQTPSPTSNGAESTSTSASERLMKRIVPAVLAVVVLAVLGFVVLPRILQTQPAAAPPAATGASESEATTTTNEAGAISSSIEPERVINVDAGITDVAYSPGGLLIAAAAPDQKVKLWNAADGALVRELEQTQAPESVAFSPDGTRIAVSQINGAVQLFNVEDGSVAVTLRDLPAGIKSRSVAINGDGTLVAAGYDDGKVRVWRVGDGELIATFAGHNDRVAQVAFGPLDQSSPLASASTNGVQVWGFDGGTEPKQSLEVDSPTIAIRPDGLAIATGGSTATVWTLSDSQRNDLPSESPVTAVAYSAKGDLGAWADAGVHLVIVDQAGTVVQRIDNAHAKPITRIAFRDDGAQVATASQDGTVKLWQVNAESTEATRAGLSIKRTFTLAGGLRSVAVSPDGTLVAIGKESQGFTLWRLSDDTLGAEDLSDSSFDVAFGPDGKTLATAVGNAVAIYDVSNVTFFTGTVDARLLRKCEGATDQIVSIALDAGSGMLAATTGNSVRTWNLSDCADTTASNFKGDFVSTEALRDIAILDNGSRVAAGGDGGLVIWLMDGSTIPTQPDNVFALAVDPNSNLLAVASNAVILRDHDLDEVRRAGSDGDVYAVAFSPDGQFLAAGYTDGKTRLWRVSDLKLLDQVQAHDGSVLDLAFTPDGKQIISVGDDQLVVLFDVTTP